MPLTLSYMRTADALSMLIHHGFAAEAAADEMLDERVFGLWVCLGFPIGTLAHFYLPQHLSSPSIGGTTLRGSPQGQAHRHALHVSLPIVRIVFILIPIGGIVNDIFADAI